MPGNSQPVRACIFDIGATLVDGPPVAPNKAIAKILCGADHREVSSVIMTTWLESPDAAVQAISDKFGALDESQEDAIRQLYASQAAAAHALPGAAKAILALKCRGFRIGLLSDIWTPYYMSVEHAIPDVISVADAIILSCRTGARKPAHENFLEAVHSLGVLPEEAVVVGDTYEHDIQPALNLGMSAVWVLRRPDREHDAIVSILNGIAPRPTAVVKTVSEITNLPLFATAAKN